MIRFQQIRNATVKLCYPNATFLIMGIDFSQPTTRNSIVS